MIELIYNEEEEAVLEEKMLPEPKNVKQIGEPREFKKIFIEDFVHTFLLQHSLAMGQKTSVAILVGNSERSGGKRHLYIKGALPVDAVTEKQGKYNFTEKIWGTVYRECEKYFPSQEIIGWFLSRPGFAIEKNAIMEETHRTFFSGADKLLFVIEPMEGESAFFGFDGNRFARQSGYYIYYEKNEPMREFIMEKNRREEKISNNEKPDVAMANFRKIQKEKQEQNEKRKKKAISYGTKVAVALVLFVGVVAFKNQMDQMKVAEQPVFGETYETEDVEISGDEVLVEELPGNVEVQTETFYEEPVFGVEQEELPVTEGQEEPQMEEVSQSQEQTEEIIAEVLSYEEYVVQAGDTLAKISRDFYGTDEKISEICALNEITNGDYIQAGEIILLP